MRHSFEVSLSFDWQADCFRFFSGVGGAGASPAGDGVGAASFTGAAGAGVGSTGAASTGLEETGFSITVAGAASAFSYNKMDIIYQNILKQLKFKVN